MRVSRFAVSVVALLAAVDANAQSAILGAGPMTNGHVPVFVPGGFGQPIVSDGGGSGGASPGVSSNPGEIGVTAISPTNAYPVANGGHGPNGEHFCVYDAPITNATGFHYVCLDPNAGGGELFSVGAVGGATPNPLQFIVNGVTYQFPFTLNSIVGPGASTVSDGVCWNNTAGTLTKDCGPYSPTVVSNTILSTLPTTIAAAVRRLGFAAAGDSPQIVYTPSSTCPYGGTQPDGFGCVASSDSKYWVATQQALVGSTPADAGAFGNASDNAATETAAIAAYIRDMGTNATYFPVGEYPLTCSPQPCTIFSSTVPVNINGAGNGAGPGDAAQANSNVTQFLLACGNCTTFQVTSNQPSYFRNFQIFGYNGGSYMTGGTGISLIGASGQVQANSVIDGVGFHAVWQPIYVLRPDWEKIQNCYFDDWGNSAVYLVTSASIEGSGGFITHNFFFGAPATTTPPIYSEVGYTDIHDNEILGGPAGVEFNIKNNDAGWIKVHDNTIEDFANYGVWIQLGDTGIAGGAPYASMAMVQHNEFSTFISTPTAAVLISDNATVPHWIDDVKVDGNMIRNSTVTNGKEIWIGAGKNVSVVNNTIDEIGANSPYGIQVTGANTNAGLIGPINVSDNPFLGTGVPVANRYSFASGAGIVLRDLQGLTQAALPGNASNGSQVFVTDGTAGSSPCTGSGTGSMAFKENSAWKCF